MPHPVPRTTSDRCPGVITLHQAEDGALARVRLPGGGVTAEQLQALANLARTFGDGRLELTSRGNVQIRGLADVDGAAIAEHLHVVGLLPSVTHERVRNIISSPMTGLGVNEFPDVSAIVRGLDDTICSDVTFASLSGRFLIAVDDGRYDVAGAGADLDVQIRTDHAVMAPLGLAVKTQSVVEAVAIVLRVFLAEAQAAEPTLIWRITDLPDGPDQLRRRAAAALAAAGIAVHSAATASGQRSGPPSLGLHPQRHGGECLVAAVPLGRLTTDQAHEVASLAGPRGIRTTPWRSVVVTDLTEPTVAIRRVHDLGFGVDAWSPWQKVSACAGRPGCSKALANVQADAFAVTTQRPPTDAVMHWSGCDRRCGRPRDTAIDVVAEKNGYVISDADGRVHRVAGRGAPTRAAIMSYLQRRS